jgi:hypothetical protein
MSEWSETRQERRARKLQSKRERIAKHGASLQRVYVDAVLKRAQRRSRRKR